MRTSILYLISAMAFFAADSALAQTAWDSPHSLFMARQSPVIDSRLQSRLISLDASQTMPVMVFLTDKGISNDGDYRNALLAAEAHLTDAAYKRRLLSRGSQNLVDFRDLPLFAPYVDRILATGARLRQTLRWFNAVSVNATAEQVEKISHFDNVRLIKRVAYSRTDYDVPREPLDDNLLTSLDYGPSAGQLNQINVVPAHELGFKGQDVIVCMMDVGYKIQHDAFQAIRDSGRLLAQYDFINHDDNTDYDPDQDVFGQADHGTYTWSALGGEASGHLYGPSFLADFLLAKTEDISSERHIEEDNWAAGAEWADSIGASVISSSLGYRWFDAGQGDYSYEDLDGNTTIVTQAADLAAYNGIAVATAMGNDGYQGSGSLIAPADGDSVIACGAVDASGYIAGFSSLGPTYDGRTKPEVCAQGVNTVCADPNDLHGYTAVGGTSLSTPLVGGSCGVLLSAHPNWTPMMVREALMMTADRFDNPDNSYGWGIMDVTRALYYHPQDDIVFSFQPSLTAPLNSPIDIDINVTGGAGISSTHLFYRSGDTGDFTQVAMSTSNGQDFSAQIPAQQGQLLQFYFEATDNNGASAYYPLGGEMHPYAVNLGATQFVDSLEAGIQYWESGGTNNSWGLTSKYTRSGALSITDSPTGNYRDNTDSWLKSLFALDLTGVSGANFSFYWRGVLQSGRDSLHVEASTDGGNTWNRFPQSINGSGFSFVQVSVDLSPYVGQANLQLRFRLITDGSTRREGIYLDDIALGWVPLGVDDSDSPIPRLLSLNQNYPNPFNPSTLISFALPGSGHVKLTIFDLLGRQVRELIATGLPAGIHQVTWDGKDDFGKDAASGIYLYKLESEDQSQIRRMTLIR